ncbi:alcohol dehydrogenase, partial [Dietzia sp. SLG310A2-38A2]|nr:alcohol dehydrogenase [Dietzia sp. SLG310A2-38A2]
RDRPPVPLDAAILFAPAGELVPVALAALAPGATLAVAGIHLSDIPRLDYQRHLFHERSVTSVESNTRSDGEEFLALAERLALRPTTHEYRLDEADDALAYLDAGDVRGAGVLRVAHRSAS